MLEAAAQLIKDGKAMRVDVAPVMKIAASQPSRLCQAVPAIAGLLLVAIAAIPFGTYLGGVIPGLNPLFLSLGVVWISTLLLLRDLRLGSGFQNTSTILKVLLILLIIIAGFSVKGIQAIAFLPVPADRALIAS